MEDKPKPNPSPGPATRGAEQDGIARRNGWVCQKCGKLFPRQDISQSLCSTCTYLEYYD